MGQEQVNIATVKEIEDGILNMVITLVQVLEPYTGKDHARTHVIDYLEKIQSGIEESQDKT